MPGACLNWSTSIAVSNYGNSGLWKNVSHNVDIKNKVSLNKYLKLEWIMVIVIWG